MIRWVAPGTAGCEADAELARELRMGHGHEGGHLLVPRLDEVDLAIALQGADHAVDAVAGIAVDPFHAPRLEAFDEEVRCLHGCTRSSGRGDNANNSTQVAAQPERR